MADFGGTQALQIALQALLSKSGLALDRTTSPIPSTSATPHRMAPTDSRGPLDDSVIANSDQRQTEESQRQMNGWEQNRNGVVDRAKYPTSRVDPAIDEAVIDPATGMWDRGQGQTTTPSRFAPAQRFPNTMAHGFWRDRDAPYLASVVTQRMAPQSQGTRLLA